jgi:hypothetical protein
MNYIKPLLTLSFWFKMAPDPLLPFFQMAFLIFFGLLVVSGIIAGQIYKKKKENFVLRFAAKYLKNWLLTAGITGFFLLFFSYERAVFLSARFWFIIWFLGLGTWLFFIIKRIKTLPQKENALRKKAQFDKYLPKRK